MVVLADVKKPSHSYKDLTKADKAFAHQLTDKRIIKRNNLKIEILGCNNDHIF